MPSFPNQKEIWIEKTIRANNFLLLDNDDWMTAFKTLTPSAFGMYLYLARLNTSDKGWELSRVDVKNKLGISDSSYERGIKELEKAGYLIQIDGNKYNAVISNPLKNEDTLKNEGIPKNEGIDTLKNEGDNTLKNEGRINNNISNNNKEEETSNKLEVSMLGSQSEPAPSSKRIVEMTRAQADAKLEEARLYNVKYKITNGMYEFDKGFIKVIDAPPLEQPKPQIEYTYDF